MNLSVIDLGIISFKEAVQRQIRVHREILQGDSSHTLILCEHLHTITLGRQANTTNILDYKFIKDNNIDFLVGVNRGGDVTYHGPGQLMGYLIFDLRNLGRDLGWFLKRIEGLIIDTIAAFNIQGNIKSGFRGVWVNERKIASIGIAVDRWVSLHGFGLNVNTDLRFFDIIKPCGLDIRMTSLNECLGGPMNMELIKRELIEQTAESFELIGSKEYLCI
ncbi:lipoyl(octanoyl) transferase LipB [bacterium]|nr:lipoyl(octanoyl) transferase LipB [bacterium]